MIRKSSFIFFINLVLVLLVNNSLNASLVGLKNFSKVKSFYIDKIALAEKSIYLLSYSLTSTDIATALILANFRGVSVKVLLSKNSISSPDSRFSYLKKNDIQVRANSINYNYPFSLMIIDGKAYKMEGNLSEYPNKPYYHVEEVLGEASVTYFSQKLLSYFMGGHDVDPSVLLFKMSSSYTTPYKRSSSSSSSSSSVAQRLPQLTVMQKKTQTAEVQPVEEKAINESTKNTVEVVDKKSEGFGGLQIISEPSEESLTKP